MKSVILFLKNLGVKISEFRDKKDIRVKMSKFRDKVSESL